MTGLFLIRWVDVRIITAGFGDRSPQVIGDQDLGQTAEETKGPDIGPDPVGQLLGQAGFGVRLVISAPDGHEEGMKGHLAGFGMGDGEALAGEVHEQFLSDPVFLPEAPVQFFVPARM
jgi:hypothetical protein